MPTVSAMAAVGGTPVRGIFWDGVRTLNQNFGTLGYFIIALFAASWIVSIAVYRWRRFDGLEIEA